MVYVQKRAKYYVVSHPHIIHIHIEVFMNLQKYCFCEVQVAYMQVVTNTVHTYCENNKDEIPVFLILGMHVRNEKSGISLNW